MGIGKDLLAKMATQNSGVQLVAQGGVPGAEHRHPHLLNGASKDMAINGASTPVDFVIAPAADELFCIFSVPLILVHAGSGSLDPEKFGIVTVLSNGLALIAEIDGVEKTVLVAKDNKDLVNQFFEGTLGSGTAATSGFFNTNKYGTGKHDFPNGLFLNGETNDKLIIRVQDNLSTIDHLEASADIDVIPL